MDYVATGRGMVLFLTQFGAGFDDPPRRAKADQLRLRILWRAPGLSKQHIVAWRDRTELPTSINYHRDHLGIIQNSFGERIRLGDGHEVRDVLHPVAPSAPGVYDYAIIDTVSLRTADRELAVVSVRVRPRNVDSSGVVGTVFLDGGTGEIVRFSFGFTRATYRDATVEDITVLLEHAQWEGRYWLPREQVIEIRRHTSWFDFPARSIIRARWEIDDYQFNQGLDPREFVGPEIVFGSPEIRESEWDHSLDDALVRFTSAPLLDAEAARAELVEVVSRSVLTGLPRQRIGGQGLSDLIRFTRVEGLGIGLGGSGAAGPVTVKAWAGYGFGDQSAKGRLRVGWNLRSWDFAALIGREHVDVDDERAVSGVVNSILAQEVGRDLGDYYARDRLAIGASRGSPRWQVVILGSRERIGPVTVVATPAHGSFRINPDLGRGTFSVVRMDLRHHDEGRQVGLGVEWGHGPGGGYVRARMAGHLQHTTGAGVIVAKGWVGVGSENLPRHRSFSVGGPGSLPGEAFRAWGGRRAASMLVEWQIAVPVPEIRLGSVITSGDRMMLAPFAGGGIASSAISGVPWIQSGGVRPVVGLAWEWFHRLVRVEAGYSVRDARWRFGFDLSRELWGIL